MEDVQITRIAVQAVYPPKSTIGVARSPSPISKYSLCSNAIERAIAEPGKVRILVLYVLT